MSAAIQAEASAGEMIIGLLVGLIVGATVGVLVASLAWAGREP